MKNKLKIIKKILKQPCYTCDGKGYFKIYNTPPFEKQYTYVDCNICKGTGIYKENYYYHIANGICFASEFIK